MNLPENWAKMLIGILTGIAGFIDFDPQIFGGHPWLISLAKYIMIGGFIGLGVVPSRPKNGNGTPPPKKSA